MYLLRAWDACSDKGAPDCVSETMSCSRWARWSSGTGGERAGGDDWIADQLAGLEEGEEEEEPCCASISH